MTIVSSSASFTPVSGAQHGPVLITFQPILLRCKKVQNFNSVLMGLLEIHTPTHKDTFTVFDWWVSLFAEDYCLVLYKTSRSL